MSGIDISDVNACMASHDAVSCNDCALVTLPVVTETHENPEASSAAAMLSVGCRKCTIAISTLQLLDNLVPCTSCNTNAIISELCGDFAHEL
jgi:hypothetical protein